jgi:DNA-binding response OmpR family regulator
METVLVIEDDRDIAQLLSTAMAMERLMPIAAYDGATGLREARRLLPDLILLDLMLPSLDGWEICRTLRADAKTRHIPIIMVSARDDEEDRVLGLDIGADDYITKPFSTREVVSRVRSVLRRRVNQTIGCQALRVGDININLDRQLVTVRNEPVHLSMMEFMILQRLAQEPGRILSRDQLLSFLWTEDCFVL